MVTAAVAAVAASCPMPNGRMSNSRFNVSFAQRSKAP